jgi:hypothetical protein
MARRRRHHRQHHGRIEEADLPATPEVSVVAAFVDVVEAEQVGEETAVELRRFEKARDVLVTAGLQHVVERRFGMTPAAGVLGRRPGLQIGDQMHLTSGHRGRNSPPSGKARFRAFIMVSKIRALQQFLRVYER